MEVEGHWESDAKSCMLGGEKIKLRMLKAIWQDKQKAVWNFLGEIGHYILLF